MKKLIPGILAILMCASCMTACDLGSFGGLFGGGETPEGPGGGGTEIEQPGETSKPEGVLTWSQFGAAEDDAIVTVSGVITGLVNSGNKHEIYFQDADGAYYAYNVTVDMSNLAVGMEISVTGTRDTYYGINQVKNATNVTILNETPTAVTATDITAALETAEYDFTNANLITAHQSKLVTIKGVTILGQNATDTSYYDFAIGGSISYARISSSTNLMNAEQTTAFETTVADNIAKVADVTGIVNTYSGKIYLIPVSADAFSNITTPNYTAEQKVAFEETLVELSAVHFTNNVTTIDLPTTGKAYSDVAISWVSGDDDYAVVNGNKLTVTLGEEETEVTVEATLTCGEASKKVTFTLYLDAATNYVVDDYSAMPAVGEAFKLHVTQTQLNQELYFTGNLSNKTYLETTTNPEEAVDVMTELVPGTTNEYYLYIQPGRTKSYIYIYNGNHDTYGANYYLNIGLMPKQDDSDVPAHTWSWNAEYNTFATTQKFHKTDKYNNSPENYVYIGTYGTYNTLSASQISYAATSMVSHPANVINGDEATVAEKLAKDKKDLTFDVTAEKATLVGAAFDSAITWTTNNSAIAIAADGTITVTASTDADVEVTVTATLTLNGESVTKDFTVTVPKFVVGSQKASKTIAELITQYGWTSSTTKQEFALDSVVSVKVNGGSNTGKAYNNDHIRIYATDTPAGSLTITLASGYELVSIKVSTQTGTYAFLCVGSGTTDISNVETAVTGSSVVLNSIKNGSDGKQVRVTAIEVVYKAV